jgi:hypothetical protein
MYSNRLPDEIEGYKEEPDKAPAFSFPLRDRYIQAGIGVKLLASLTGKPTPKVRTNALNLATYY